MVSAFLMSVMIKKIVVPVKKFQSQLVLIVSPQILQHSNFKPLQHGANKDCT